MAYSEIKFIRKLNYFLCKESKFHTGNLKYFTNFNPILVRYWGDKNFIYKKIYLA